MFFFIFLKINKCVINLSHIKLNTLKQVIISKRLTTFFY